MRNWNRMFMAAFFSVGLAPLAWAQHGHGEQGHEHGKAVEFKMPTTYAGAVGEIEHRLHEISELMASKQLAKVHAEADVIQKVAKVIGQLALKADSGVPQESVKEVNLAGKDLAAKFNAIDAAADSGDAAGTKAVYDEMVQLAGTLAKYVPKVYRCPMRCEGEKTYDKPGKCPECGMVVQDVKSHLDHEPKHGGVFFMTPDQKHHLEGTYSTSNEFRVYFYDEYTKPIPALRFAAEGEAWRAEGPVWSDGQEKAKAFRMHVGPQELYLTGQVDAAITFPVRIALHVDFKDGTKPPAFSFDFDQASQEPSGGKEQQGRDGQ